MLGFDDTSSYSVGSITLFPSSSVIAGPMLCYGYLGDRNKDVTLEFRDRPTSERVERRWISLPSLCRIASAMRSNLFKGGGSTTTSSTHSTFPEC